MRIMMRAFLAATTVIALVAIAASHPKPTSTATAHRETATFAAGCFWGLQETLRQIPGVVKTTAGYTGGTTPNPSYELVAADKTGHQEAVEVVFDPARLSYAELLSDFLTASVPARLATSTNTTHHPAIYYHNESQRQTADLVKQKINQFGKWESPYLADIRPAVVFYPAEEFHQDYYRKNPSDRSCRVE